MRMTRFLTLLLLLLAGSLYRATAQNVTLVVTTLYGQEQSYQLSEECQLFFENGERLIIDDGTGTPVTYQLSEIRKLVCSEVASTDESLVSKLQILPNPLHNYFVVKNLTGTYNGQIYTLDGQLVKTFEATEGMMVDISELAKGMYLLHINGQTLKMIKL